MNCKGFGRNRSWPNCKVLSRHSPGGTEKTTKNLNHYSRDLNPGPPEYKAGVLTTRPRRPEWNSARKGSSGMVYRYIPVHFEHWAYRHVSLPSTKWCCAQGRTEEFVGPRPFSSIGPFGDSKCTVGNTVYSGLSGLMEGVGCTDNWETRIMQTLYFIRRPFL
jgi:hypothetical protein